MREIERLRRERDDARARAKEVAGGGGDEDDDAEDGDGASGRRRGRDGAREMATKTSGSVPENVKKAPLRAYTAPKDLSSVPEDAASDEDLESDEALGFGKSKKIIDRESDYAKRRFNRALSPGRESGKVRCVRDLDARVETSRRASVEGGFRFKLKKTAKTRNVAHTRRGGGTSHEWKRLTKYVFCYLPMTQDEGRTYAERMKEVALEREKDNTLRNIERKQREEAERAADEARGGASERAGIE